MSNLGTSLSEREEREQLVADERWRLVRRIVASPAFLRSPRLSDFLIYICERALDGRSEEISEQQIGVHVFSRPPNYNPNDDSIVRSHARLLRQRLTAYFDGEGKAEELRVQIPKGHYIPQFERTPSVRPRDFTREAPPVERTSAFRSRWIVLAAGIAGMVAYGIVLWVVPGEQPSQSAAHHFWKTFFSSGKKVSVVPADSALALFEDLSHEPVHLAEYLTRKYRFRESRALGVQSQMLSSIAARPYTSMADLNLTVRLSRLSEVDGRQVEVRYARNLQLADLKEGSAVLIGGPRANPWEELFQEKLNFYVDAEPLTAENGIVNKAPRQGERARYSEAAGESSARAYGLVAFLPGLTPATRVLIVEGTSSVGTECASDFLLDEVRLGSFLQQISRGNRNTPYFEVLLQSATIGGNAQQPEAISYRLIKE
jgi:hypothetical protein